jgi:CheY-like chemotaxis protein
MTTSMAHPVLVVDDDEVMRDALVTLLSGEGYEVVSASNGREALDRLRETTPSVILLDYAMPVMDGLAFREAQKADARLSSIPVILLTAHRVTTFDALAILPKPLSYEMLAPLLERACRRAADP